MCIFLANNAFAGATDEVRKVVDNVVKIVSDKEMKKNDSKRRQELKKTISVIFDYGEMSKRSLGKNWNQRSANERKQFTDLFATLLENSYAGKIESYNNEKIVYIKENIDGEYAEVKSKVVTSKRDEFTLDYRLLNKDGKWMAYDVVIEGVSLVSNYRTQFNKIIASEGYPALLKKLQTKSDELKSL
jgi:phospholipid transport system substrate-binding protein